MTSHPRRAGGNQAQGALTRWHHPDQDAQYEQYRKPTRRDVFLATMDEIVPWQALCEVIEPHYPKAGNGRSPVGLGRMLRMYLVQHWFNLADVAGATPPVDIPAPELIDPT